MSQPTAETICVVVLVVCLIGTLLFPRYVPPYQ